MASAGKLDERFFSGGIEARRTLRHAHRSRPPDQVHDKRAVAVFVTRSLARDTCRGSNTRNSYSRRALHIVPHPLSSAPHPLSTAASSSTFRSSICPYSPPANSPQLLPPSHTKSTVPLTMRPTVLLFLTLATPLDAVKRHGLLRPVREYVSPPTQPLEPTTNAPPAANMQNIAVDTLGCRHGDDAYYCALRLSVLPGGVAAGVRAAGRLACNAEAEQPRVQRLRDLARDKRRGDGVVFGKVGEMNTSYVSAVPSRRSKKRKHTCGQAPRRTGRRRRRSSSGSCWHIGRRSRG